MTLKWRDMDPVRKTIASLILVWSCLNLYLVIGNELALLNVTVLPFSWIYSIAGVLPLWSLTATMVGLAAFFQLRFPKRQVVA